MLFDKAHAWTNSFSPLPLHGEADTTQLSHALPRPPSSHRTPDARVGRGLACHGSAHEITRSFGPMQATASETRLGGESG